MKRCLAANTSWCIALLEYLSTPPGANISSPSELIGRQFRGLLPFFQDHSTSESIKEQVLILKEKEKQRHDTSAYDLPVIPVGAMVSYLNKDQKTWSIGTVESHTLRSYVILTEEGRLISCNCVHLRCTNVSFQSRPSRLDVPHTMNPKVLPTNIPNKDTKESASPTPTNTGQPSTPCKTVKKSPVSTPLKVELRTKSGRLVKIPARYQQ